MLFRQYLDKEPVIAVSYLFGCPTEGVGAVVDPIGDIGRYLKESEKGGVPLCYVFDTHLNADHISPARELAEAAGAEYVLFAGTEASFSFKGVEDGEVLHMGNTEIEVLHTPGHTPEHISLVVTDHARADEPWLVLTGHTLMVSDMGRTELATSAEEGGEGPFPERGEATAPPRPSRGVPRRVLRVGVRSRAQREPELDHRLRAPPQPRVRARERGGLRPAHAGGDPRSAARRGSHTGHQPRARARWSVRGPT